MKTKNPEDFNAFQKWIVRQDARRRQKKAEKTSKLTGLVATITNGVQSTMREMTSQVQKLNRYGFTNPIKVGVASSIVTAVGKEYRVIRLVDLTGVVSGLMTAEQKPIFDRYDVTIIARSQYPYMLVPFIARLENGELITATDEDDTSSVAEVINIACGLGQKIVVPQTRIDPDYDPTTAAVSFRSKNTLRLADALNHFTKHLDQQLINEENANQLDLGLLLAAQPSTTVDFYLNTEYEVSQANRTLKDIV